MTELHPTSTRRSVVTIGRDGRCGQEYTHHSNMICIEAHQGEFYFNPCSCVDPSDVFPHFPCPLLNSIPAYESTHYRVKKGGITLT
jgi:hypothetical protein